MIKQQTRKPLVQKRHRSIRVKLSGTSEFPRLAVYRSTKHIYAQLIDDVNHVTIASASSNDKDLKEKLAHGGNIEAAKVVGETIAQKAKKAGVYRGRKPKEFDREKLMELLREVESKKMTAKEAAAILNISIDKYYRLKRQINKFGNTSAY